jgi:hypothetical protein
MHSLCPASWPRLLGALALACSSPAEVGDVQSVGGGGAGANTQAGAGGMLAAGAGGLGASGGLGGAGLGGAAGAAPVAGGPSGSVGHGGAGAGAGAGGVAGAQIGVAGGSSGHAGAAGQGAAGASAACQMIASEYAAELEKQLACDPQASSPCTDRAVAAPGCSCRLLIEPSDPFAIESLSNLEAGWFEADCATPTCSATCSAAAAGICQVDPKSARGGRCVTPNF